MAEQTPTARTLNYGLGKDILERVKGATTAEAKISRQELTGKVGAVNQATLVALQIGAAADSAAKKNQELNDVWGDTISRGDWATTDARKGFEADVREMQEEYIQAVRMGDKQAQEDLLADLGARVTALDSMKEVGEEMVIAYDDGNGYMTDTDIVSIEDQESAAYFANNKGISYPMIDGTMYAQQDVTAASMERAWVGADRAPKGYFLGLLDDPNSTYVINFDEEKFPETKDMSLEEEREFARKWIEEHSEEELNKLMISDRQVTVQRNMNANQLRDLNRRNTNPTEIEKGVTDILTNIQENASAEKATYFDPVGIQRVWSNGFTKDDQVVMMKKDIGFGSSFVEDFKAAPILDMAIPLIPLDIPGQGGDENYAVQFDKNNDGVLTPDEFGKLQDSLGEQDWDNDPDTPETLYQLTDNDKDLVIAEMMKPKHFEVAKEHFSIWATMKSAQVHNNGVKQRFTQETGTTTTGARTAVDLPQMVGSNMYGTGYYDPASVTTRYDAQRMASQQLGGINALNPDGSKMEEEIRTK